MAGMRKRREPEAPDDYSTDSASVASSTDAASFESSDDDDANLGNCGAGPTYTHFPRSQTWERSADCRAAKNRHQERLDEEYAGNREARIYETTLKGRDVNLEANMFPYECDEGISHWTLWSRRDLAHDEIVRFVRSWCLRSAPWVSEFAYEENPHVSFCVPHVHIFLRRRAGSGAAVPPKTVTPPPSPPPTKRRKLRRWDVPPAPVPR